MLQRKHNVNLRAADLFSGGGGLTVGLKRAGFTVVGAVEIEPHAAATYEANHPETQLLTKDIRDVSGGELLKLSSTGRIDVLAGCPPCQGFSSLTSKYKRDDPRNYLINEFGRLVSEIMPRAIMVENVPGLELKGKNLFAEFMELISALGYIANHDILQVADYGIPQSRRRLVLLAGLGFRIFIPQRTHDRLGRDGLQKWVPIKDVLRGLDRPIELEKTKAKGGPKSFNWHVVRTLSSQNVRRLVSARAGLSWTSIPERLRPVCHKNPAAGFPNVYGRMKWSDVSPTITGGCTTLSKGRFGHPSQLRTISVREAALLQTFPMNYEIATDFMEHACNIVGNALPCNFAEILARQCYLALVHNSGKTQ